MSARVGVLGVLTALVALTGVVISALAVHALVDDLEPAARANEAIYRDLTDLSAAVQTWTSTGLPASADDYDQATLQLTDHLREVRAAHEAVSGVFDDRVRTADDGVALRLRATMLAIVVAAAGTCLLVARSTRRLDAELDDLADARDRARAVEVWIEREVRALDTAKDDFVANVSHELRTPLTTISGYLELVAEEFEGRMEARHERMLDATRRNVARLKLLIDDLLGLQRAEGSHQMEPVDLSAVVRDVAMDVKISAARREIRVDVRTPTIPVLVLADRAMLQRAVLNLVSNAVKFSAQGGVVDVVVTATARQAEVVVADRGLGIPSGELDRLGTRFFRASNAVRNEIAGTGLGVRIAQLIVDRHAGTVAFTSEEGVGTTVVVRLPVPAEPAQLVVPEPRAPDASEVLVATVERPERETEPTG